MSYANGTVVPAEKSRMELEKILRRAGAVQHGFMNDGQCAMVAFILDGRHIKLSIKIPTLQEMQARSKYSYDEKRLLRMVDQEERRLWRVMVLLVKAKLEAVAQGLSDVQREFLADLVVENGKTVSEVLHAQLDEVRRGGKVKLLLGAARG